MKTLLIAVSATALLAAQPAAAADLGATAAALRDKALSDPTAWNVLESLTTEVGARPVGSPAMTQAKDWGVAKLKSLGFEKVHVEPFVTGSWLRGAESAELVGAYPRKLAILGLGNSTPTPAGGLEAEIVLYRTYEAFLAAPAAEMKGKIVVVTGRMVRAQDGSGYGAINAQRTRGPAEAAKRGAAAYLLRSLSTDDTRLPHTGTAGPGGIPAAALSTVDAELLEHLADRGQPIRIRLNLQSTYTPKADAWNVVGELKGREKPDEVLVVGGHLDSWDPGTGAIDDGSGVAIATAAAKLAASGAQRPRRTIRVVMWGSEEQGGSGEAYGAAHKAETPAIVVAGESDLGAGHIWSLSVPKNSLSQPAMKAFTAAIAPLKVIVTREAPRFGGSDIEGLIANGAPFVDFNQDASRYFDLHHSADDTLDKVDPAELAQNVAVWTAFLYTVADSDIDFRALAAQEAK
ncbi:M20/M25/M40 family metallo-hydrolase [Phenylobacterium aquaticum]|uniref:M20/M25/M40 family metallo-hydrolase n=2 Tax=Phenylobacterium aquaticum TaxID=1763816 RepID=UPI0026F1F1C6|nr:M20/M25/M40 family metallo-hydrolase [Phenylobacterium aquaticum]